MNVVAVFVVILVAGKLFYDTTVKNPQQNMTALHYPKKWELVQTSPSELDQPLTTLVWNKKENRVEEENRVLDLELLGLEPFKKGYRLPDELQKPHTFLHVTRWPHPSYTDLYFLLGVGSYTPTFITPKVVANQHFKYDPRNNSPVSNEPWLRKELGKGEESRFIRIRRLDGKPPKRVPLKHEFIHLNHFDHEGGEHYYYTLGAVNFVMPMTTV